MAGIKWIIFAFCVASSGAQFGFNNNGPKSFRPLQLTSPRKAPVTPKLPFLRALQRTLEDRKCFTLARRPFYMVRMMQYPCSKGLNGVPVVRSFMGRMGPICQSYLRVPVIKYYKITSCCPGWSADTSGKCTIRNRNRIPALPKPVPRNPLRTMAIASSMRMAMWERAKQIMARKRAMMAAAHMARMARMRQMHRMIRPPMSPLPYIINKIKARLFNRRPKIALLRFNRPGFPPVPRPFPRPPLRTRIIRIVPGRTPSRMFDRPNRIRFPPMQRPFPIIPRIPRVFRPFPIIPRPVPTMVLSNRGPTVGFRPMQKMHYNEPEVPQIPAAPKVEPTSPTQIPADYPVNKPFPQIPVPDKEPVGSEKPFPTIPVVQFRPPAPRMQEGILPEEEQQMMQVDLPHNPVQMPELIVEEGPMNQGQQQSCIVILESAVKSCLKKNKIDVPDVMTAFEPFNDDTSRVLCEKEVVIFKCINDAIKECSESPDETTARGMLEETTETVRDMCAMRQMSVEVTDPVAAEATFESDKVPVVAESNTGTDTKSQDTGAVIDIVEDVPKASPVPEKKETIKDTAATANEMQQAIKHEVHLEALEMREHYLPILIGSGVGFVILTLLLSLTICCCCKRKLKRRMKMAKETEKPPLEGIYTIGVPPPVYEVKGIPPVYYEEAKGEKITSGSPSVLEGSDGHIAERDEHTPM